MQRSDPVCPLWGAEHDNGEEVKASCWQERVFKAYLVTHFHNCGIEHPHAQAHIQWPDLLYPLCYQSYFHNCVITAVILSGQDQSVCVFCLLAHSGQASYLRS